MMLSFCRHSGGRVRARLLVGSGLGLICALPLETGGPAAAQTEQVLITGERPDAYKIDAPTLSKLSEPLIDTPQTIAIIPETVLKERAVANLNDALKTVPGITLGAGEFKFLGNAPTIRGFVARNDMFLDGIRDFGNYYRDPFNLEEIEVLEGPSSVLFGRGSTGGVVNQASKFPSLDNFISGTLTAGTDLERRAIIDIEEPVPDLGAGAALRLTAMGHQSRVAGRNVAEQSRYGFAPSLAVGLGTPTRFMLSLFHQSADDIPDYGIPYFASAPAPVPRQTFYGFDSDFLKTDTDIATAKAEHDISPAMSLRNQVRYGHYTRDFRLTEPLVSAPVTTPLDQVMVTRNVDSGTGLETLLWDQFEGTLAFETGGLRHTLVAGLEGGRESARDEFDNSSGVPSAPLLSPNPHVPFNAASTFPRFKTDTVAWSVGAYALDTVKLGDAWELSAGIRWDSFNADYRDENFSTATPGLVTRTDRIERTDQRPSYRAALVYKPETNGSLYFSYGTSFNPSAEDLSFIVSSRSFLLSNKDLAPETNRSFELGSKWDVLSGRLALSGAVFRLEKSNARVPDPTNAQLNVLGGTFRVDGLQIQAVGAITENWQISAGYALLDSHVVTSAPGAAPVSAPLMNTPRNSFTAWTDYRIGGGFSLGGGVRFSGSVQSQNVPPIKTVPGYWVVDAIAKYAFSPRMSLQLNVNNLFDTYYFDQVHFFHVVPAEARVALLTLNVRY